MYIYIYIDRYIHNWDDYNDRTHRYQRHWNHPLGGPASFSAIVRFEKYW